ncbi:ABC transporter permease [Gehongia tenuis]|uniref:ABC transporter permease n=1 Tax=Gehongia tenuis TaxID=2763655 RepID=A0A926HNK4_9FIRM|nr:ABC transporter permease [Gehongia tenuis]MBC8530253.1 ABC transporter permease [Gehongia tenuis]
MTAVFKREVRSYFLAPLGYVFIGAFMLVTGILFSANSIFGGDSSVASILDSASFIFMLLVPILTMRLFSEERKAKTDQLWLTSPLSITQVVLGKYFAALFVFAVTLVLTAIYPILISIYASIHILEVLVEYLGFFLMGATLISVGTLISTLTENQVVAAVGTFGAILIMWIMDFFASMVNVTIIGINLQDVLAWFSVYTRFDDFMMGILAPAPVIYYLSFTAVCLFLAVRTIDKRRWGEG